MPKLTLRDLFWLVLVVAMGLGWWADQQRKNRWLKEMDREYKEFREWTLKEIERQAHEIAERRAARSS
jgi:hypothetical protein